MYFELPAEKEKRISAINSSKRRTIFNKDELGLSPDQILKMLRGREAPSVPLISNIPSI